MHALTGSAQGTPECGIAAAFVAGDAGDETTERLEVAGELPQRFGGFRVARQGERLGETDDVVAIVGVGGVSLAKMPDGGRRVATGQGELPSDAR